MTGSTTLQTVAIFDLDGTLTRGDTFLAFLIYVLKRNPLRLRHCVGLPHKVAMSKLGRMSNDVLKAAFLGAILKGATRDEIREHAVLFAEKCVRQMVKPAVLARIKWHRSKDIDLSSRRRVSISMSRWLPVSWTSTRPFARVSDGQTDDWRAILMDQPSWRRRTGCGARDFGAKRQAHNLCVLGQLLGLTSSDLRRSRCSD